MAVNKAQLLRGALDGVGVVWAVVSGNEQYMTSGVQWVNTDLDFFPSSEPMSSLQKSQNTLRQAAAHQGPNP